MVDCPARHVWLLEGNSIKHRFPCESCHQPSSTNRLLVVFKFQMIWAHSIGLLPILPSFRPLPSVTYIPMHLGYNSCGRPFVWVFPINDLPEPDVISVIIRDLTKLGPTKFTKCESDQSFITHHSLFHRQRIGCACHRVQAKAKATQSATVKTLKSLACFPGNDYGLYPLDIVHQENKWDFLGNILGICWGYVGNIVGICWEYFLGICWEYFLGSQLWDVTQPGFISETWRATENVRWNWM